MLTCSIQKRLESFDLSIALQMKEQVMALYGPSGSGKSLTLQAIAGLLTPDAGHISVGNQVLFDSKAGVNLPPRARSVGYLFQNYALFPHLSAAQNVGYGLHRIGRAEREERVQEALRAVRLEGLQERRPAQLSGGQQQRVALARALVTRPKLLLLDEPFGALDSIIREQLHGELLHLLADLPIPTMLVTHSLDEAYALSREIAVYEAGRVLQAGPRAEVYYRPNSPAVARLVGAKNMLQGQVTAVTAVETQVQCHGLVLTGPPGSFTVGQQVVCCIRPEHVMLLRKDRVHERLAPGEVRVTGRIVREMTYGGYIALLFRPDSVAGAAPLADLHITMATYIYDRLRLEGDPRQTLSLKSRYLHLLPDQPQTAAAPVPR